MEVVEDREVVVLCLESFLGMFVGGVWRWGLVGWEEMSSQEEEGVWWELLYNVEMLRLCLDLS